MPSFGFLKRKDKSNQNTAPQQRFDPSQSYTAPQPYFDPTQQFYASQQQTVVANVSAQPVPAPVSRNRPANFNDDDYRPGGLDRVKFSQSLLGESNTVFVMDNSGSMGSFWRQVQQVLAVLVDGILQNDKDGLDWYWLNDQTYENGDAEEGIYGTGIHNIENPDFIVDMFEKTRPHGLTYLGERMKPILDTYLKRCEDRSRPAPKPLNIIVWTDGAADDQNLLQNRIIDAAKRLDAINAKKRQLAIQFLQVGNYPGVSEYLKRLDDNLKEASGDANLRDIVDTKKFQDIEDAGGFNAASLLNVLCGAMIPRLDKKSDANA